MTRAFLFAACAISIASISHAQTEQSSTEQGEQATAAGTCEEAKQQHQYWCEERESVSVVSFGMECENAKRNMAEACGEAAQGDSTQ